MCVCRPGREEPSSFTILFLDEIHILAVATAPVTMLPFVFGAIEYLLLWWNYFLPKRMTVPKQHPPPWPLMPDGRMYCPLDDFVLEREDGSLLALTRGQRIEIGRTVR